MVDKQSKSFKQFIDNMVGTVGINAQTAVRENDIITSQMTALHNLRQEISGVNIDEEMAALISYQHGYQAAAKFITVIDRMLETIIQKLI